MLTLKDAAATQSRILLAEYGFFLEKLGNDKDFTFASSDFEGLRNHTAASFDSYLTYLSSEDASCHAISKVLEVKAAVDKLLVPPTPGHQPPASQSNALTTFKTQALKMVIFATSEVFDRLAPFVLGSMVGMMFATHDHVPLTAIYIIIGFSLATLAFAAWSFKEIKLDAERALDGVLATKHPYIGKVAKKTYVNACAYEAIATVRQIVASMHAFNTFKADREIN